MSSRKPTSQDPTGGGRGEWQPEGWRTGPAWREMNRPARRRRRLMSAVGVLLVGGAAVWAVNPGDIRSRLPGASRAEAAPPLPAETARPSAAPGSEVFPDTPTLKEPFAGSPAARYADGAAGIVLPEAKPVGTLSKEQVAAALRRTKEFLVAANLDPKTLRGERPSAALGLLDPQQPGLLRDLGTSLDKPSKEHDPLLLFSRFDPKEVALVGEVVKTRGRMTFEEAKDGALGVNADYTFVYPVVKAGQGRTEVTRTVVRRVIRMEVVDPRRFVVTPGKLQLIDYRQESGNSACGVFDGYFHPAFSTDPASPAPAGPEADPYDRSRELNDEGQAEGCGTVSRI